MKKWTIRSQDPEAVKKLAASAKISEFAAALLVNRSILTREQADEFFNSEEITSPFNMEGMEKAVEVISDAIENGEKITVYGDYDCDGVTAVAILYGYLEAIGAEADWYIPSRGEGYGLNNAAIDKLAKNGTRLIVTVDNGISAVNEADYIYKQGMRLIITDHHRIPEKLPQADAVINPHLREDMSACKDLAGCGVALKLVMALENDIDNMMESWCDLAAIGTVGDIVPLTGENRVIVKKGLENLTVTENGGLRALLSQCGIDDEMEVTSEMAAFTICPRINAAGRFSHAKEAAELFLSDNPFMLNKMAENLSCLNLMRKDEEAKITEEIFQKLKENPLMLKQRVLVISGKGWNHGVIGIAASKLLNRFGKPVLIITEEGEQSRGSGRSIDGFSLYKMLNEISEHMIKFGGHTKAAGFSLLTGKIPEFTAAVQNYAKKYYTQMPLLGLTAEFTLSGADITAENVECLDYFRPFGDGNPSPLFHVKNAVIKSIRSLKDGKYTAFNAEIDGSEFKVLNFHSAYAEFPYKAGENVDMLVSAEINEYNGRRSINLMLSDIRRSGFSQERYFAAQSAYERLCLGEDVTEVPAKRIVPDREVQTAVYDIIKQNTSLSACADLAGFKGINYCLFRVTLDVFENAGLIRTDVPKDKIERLKVTGKTDLNNCEILVKLRKKFGL